MILSKKALAWIFMVFGTAFMVVSCGGDDEGMMSNDPPIASFQFEISTSNFLEVTFTNFSQNASSYTWDFGDGNVSNEENPTHTYSEGGDYVVELTATNTEGSRSVTKNITITDPNTAIKLLTGDNAKVWKLSRNIVEEEYPLQVGPVDRSQIWWAYGLNDPVGARPCLMEEEYIFSIDGTYTYDAKGEIFADYGIWSADLEGVCIDETDPSQMVGLNGEDLTAWGSGQHSFEYDVSAGTLTLTGLGAHVGLPKVATTAEVSVPQPFVTYKVTSLETDGPVDKLILETSIEGGYWQFFLVSYDNPADEPDLPGAPPTAAFDFTVDGSVVTFENKSINAESYSWEFGDGNGSSEESPVHDYMNDGIYTAKLTADNANGSSEVTATITVTSADFSIEVLNGDGSKVWRLNPAAGALAVGPGKGSGEWFQTSEDDVMTRSCTFDDTYTFDNAGNFSYASNGDLWAEAYMGIDPAGCVMEDMLAAEAAAWGSGAHNYEVTQDGGVSYLTVRGTGAFIGLPKAFNGGEYTMGPPMMDGSVTYEVLSYVNDGSKEILQLTIDISDGEVGGSFWTFTLVSE